MTGGGWSGTVLLEGHQGPWIYAVPSHPNIRTSDEKYVKKEDGFRRLNGLNTDPYELNNAHEAATQPPR